MMPPNVAGDGPERDGRQGGRTGREGALGSDHGKERKPKGVGPEEEATPRVALDPCHPFRTERVRRPGDDDADDDVAGLGDPEHRPNAEQEVADRAAADAGCRGEEREAEGVHPRRAATSAPVRAKTATPRGLRERLDGAEHGLVRTWRRPIGPPAGRRRRWLPPSPWDRPWRRRRGRGAAPGRRSRSRSA